MYQLIGFEKNLETVITLSYQQLLQEKNPDTLGLKRAYNKFLRNIQSDSSVPASDSMDVEFVSNPNIIKNLIEQYKVRSALDDKDQSKAIIPPDSNQSFELMQIATQNCQREFGKLKHNYPEFTNLFELVINYVFCALSNVSGGGSTSNAIGIIWASPKSNWQSEDFVEFYTHEFTHHLVFLDERRYQHYIDYDLILDSDNFCRSAILCMARPLDKVFHSLLVATEVLLTRENVLGHPQFPKIHPPTEDMLDNCFQTISSIETLQARKSILTARGLELMNLCKDKLHEISKSQCKQKYAVIGS
ncbi:hypothetical protein NIES2101_13360 [Calothrix sp. HK-06]|nr:hypothetical protein NIES2101_13360 [Calothrix sp. HK-06]